MRLRFSQLMFVVASLAIVSRLGATDAEVKGI